MTVMKDTEHTPSASPPRKPRRTPLTERSRFVLALQVLIVVGLLAAWELGAATGFIDTFLFSSPSRIAEVLARRAETGALWTDIGVTMTETVLGYLVGAVGGSVLGLALWYSSFVAGLTRPFITAIGAIPILAIAPLIIIWFGTDIVSKIVIVALSCVVVSLTNSYRGAQEVDADWINLMRSFGATKTQTFFKIIVPGAGPWVMQGLRLNVGFAVVGAIVGEFISSSSGIGHMIVRGSATFSLSTVFAGLVVVVFMVSVLSLAMRFVERILPGANHIERK
ncbi:ABC transporter permease [Mycolicibacterium vaccae ATCC 25954]|uniref:ABC transporter permease n=2 Tax=Mycolicibacterium vaccae TaxID=1810 RepID=K0V0I3_MYCVA|nr:ABC transporter permease [Mycolicibacterium vaccae ATCC 25954]